MSDYQSNQEKDPIQRLEKKMDTVIDLFSRILESVPCRKCYTIKDIALDIGVSIRTIKGSLWLQPNFGITDIPGRQKKWLPDTYKTWFKVSPAERKRQWQRMDREERLRIAMM